MLDVIKKHIESGKIYKIVFFGSSITSTEWVHPNWREIIEYVVKKKISKMEGDWKRPSWGIRCINSGLDGSTSDDWIEKVDEYVLSYKPDLVISLFGSNDQTFNFSIAKHKKNLEILFEKISQSVKNYYFCTTTPYNNQVKNEGFEPYLQAEKSIEFPDNVKFVNLFDQYKKFDLDKLFTFVSDGNEVVGINPGEFDYLHPNQLGNAYIAKVLFKEIFGIEFDPERYMKDTLDGKMYPGY